MTNPLNTSIANAMLRYVTERENEEYFSRYRGPQFIDIPYLKGSEYWNKGPWRIKRVEQIAAISQLQHNSFIQSCPDAAKTYYYLDSIFLIPAKEGEKSRLQTALINVCKQQSLEIYLACYCQHEINQRLNRGGMGNGDLEKWMIQYWHNFFTRHILTNPNLQPARFAEGFQEIYDVVFPHLSSVKETVFQLLVRYSFPINFRSTP